MYYKRVFALIVLPAMMILALAVVFTVLNPVQADDSTNNDALTISGQHNTTYFAAFLSGDEEVPSVTTDALGVARFTLVNTDTLNYEVAVRDIISITASHIHLGALGTNGGVVFPLYTGSGSFDPDNPISGTLMLTTQQYNDLLAGNYYVNVHTTANPGGEIRGQILAAETQAFWTALSGAKEVGPVDSQASGLAYLALSPDMSQLYYRLMVAGIENVTASHIHEAAVGQNGGVVFPLYTGGGDFGPGSPVSSVLTPTLSQVTAMMGGDYYINVHTTDHPSGEIRGQVGSYDPRSDYHALLTGAEEVPPVTTTAVGVAHLSLSSDLASLDFEVAVDNIANVTASHIHTGWPGQNGSVAHPLYPGGGSFGPGNPVTGTLSLNAQNVLDLISGYYYVNVHTTGTPSGEIRGQVSGVSQFDATLAGSQEVPPVTTSASGKAVFALSDDATELHYRVMVSDIPTVTASHIHMGAAGVNGGVVFPLFTGGGTFDEDNPISGMLSLNDANIFALLAGDYYVNVHTTNTPSGEIRGQIGQMSPFTNFQATLAGDQEVPPVTTTASGEGNFRLDSDRNVLHYYISVNSIANVTASHIHQAPVGVLGPVVFPLFTGSGTFDPSNPVGSGVELDAAYYYVNVHTSDNPSGEIRGQIDTVIHEVYIPLVFKN
jgi:hypothetical protein